MIEIGGDYPRDQATRSLVVNALALAALLQRQPTLGLVESRLVRAARGWHQAHAPGGNAKATAAQGSGSSGH